MLEVTPGVSRKLHQPKKHLLNPVIRSDRWCDGNYMQPYTTMYDEEDKLFKMWVRAGGDRKAGYVGGNAAYMLYFTSTDGVHWDKPDLGVVEVAGRRDHNVIFTSDMVLKSPTSLSYGPDRFVVPTTAMTPQGKKPFFGGSTSILALATRRKNTSPWRSFRIIAAERTSSLPRMGFAGLAPLLLSGRLRTMSPRKGTIA
ncbi:MAG: hypothetical protein ABIK89_05730 [Planctomycetota bacterium]